MLYRILSMFRLDEDEPVQPIQKKGAKESGRISRALLVRNLWLAGTFLAAAMYLDTGGRGYFVLAIIGVLITLLLGIVSAI